MTHRQRMLAAIRRQPVDRVPVCTYNLHPYGSPHEADPSYVPILECVARKAGIFSKTDVQGLYEPTDVEHRSTLVEEVAGVTRTTRFLHTPKGDLCQVTEKPADQPAYVTEAYVKSDADIDRFLSLPWEPTDPDLSAARALRKRIGEAGIVGLGYHDPMYEAITLFDYEDFLMRCVDDLDGVVRLIDVLFERLEMQMRKLAKRAAGSDFFMHTGGPEAATPPMMPPHLFARLVTPYQKRLVDIFHEHGLLVALHCHGRVRLVLDEIIACGFDLLEPVEPPPQGDMSLPEIMEKAGGRLAVMGHIQDQDLHNAPAGHFREFIETLAPQIRGRTGVMLSPTATPFQHPATDTSVRNYIEWVEAADTLLA